jgi:hypothetical protein
MSRIACERVTRRGKRIGRGGLMLLAVGGAFAAAAAAGCGGQDPDGAGGGGGGGGEPVPEAMSYFPLTSGASWSYNIVRKGVGKSKVLTVDGAETLGAPKEGVTAVRVRQDQEGDVQNTWFERTGNTVVIHRQQEMDVTGAQKFDEWYLPHDIRINEGADQMHVGGSWSVSYKVERSSTKDGAELKDKIHQFDIESMNEVVNVPAGTFTTIRVRRSDPSDGSYRQYWYAAGLGKVRELEGNGDSEELTAFTGVTPAQ